MRHWRGVRLLGLLPLAILGLAVAVNLHDGTPSTILWICNVCNGLLGVSLLLAWPRGIWIATLWLLAGLPLWLLDGFLTSRFEVHSFFTHFVTPALGLYALRRVPRPRHLWWQAVLFGIGLQLVSRALTPPSENVNLAFTSYHSLQGALPGFATSWIIHLLGFTALMLGLQLLLTRFVAAKSGEETARAA